ncbi:MAG: hypothetical protein HFF18_14360 [Oscillospiraceae bacterium]|nr:hypothetical protein [Oscillospiraceae bacterium]
MKKHIVSLLVLCVAFMFCMQSYAVENANIPQEVLTVAADSADTVRSKIQSNPTHWGFSNSDEIEMITLGQGYHVNYVGKEQILAATGTSVSELIDPDIIDDTWEFTLNLDGIPQIFMTIGYEDGAYRLVSFGGNAEDFGSAQRDIVGLSQLDGFTVSDELVAIDGSYYFWVTGDNEYLLPVSSANEQVSRNGDKLISVGDLTSNLKDLRDNDSGGAMRGGGQLDTPTQQNISLRYMALVSSVILAISVIIVCRIRKQ